MFVGKLRRAGNSLVLTVPADELDRLGLTVGQQVAVELHRVEVRPVLSPELEESVDRLFPVHERAIRYLADK
jgi:antitoxin component of MazEF toxin-antitoxin module